MVDIANSDSSNIFSSELSDGQFWKKSDTINRIDHNENLVGFIEKFKDKTIAVVGDLALDWHVRGDAERINPEMPAATLIRVVDERYSLGCAGNVAANLAALGSKVVFYTRTHKDYHGEALKKIFSDLKIDLVSVESPGATIVKQRIMERAHNHYVGRVDYGESQFNILDENQAEIIFQLISSSEGLNGIILSDYNKGLFSGNLSERIINWANEKGIPVFIDPKPKNISRFRNATLIRPNEKEAREIVGSECVSIESVLNKLKEISRAKYTIVTRGKEGMAVLDGDYHSIGTKVKEVVDVTGAGDTVMATLALSMISGASVVEAANLANYAAGIVVEKPGTATVSREELLDRINQS